MLPLTVGESTTTSLSSCDGSALSPLVIDLVAPPPSGAESWCSAFERKMRTLDGLKYAVWQLERAPSSGRLHLQGFCQLSTPKALKSVKKLLGNPTVHLEPAASVQDSVKYCQKEDTRRGGPWTVGTLESLSSQGARSDLKTLLGDIKQQVP